MKEQAIQKINKIGKISGMIASVMGYLAVFATVVYVIVGIIGFVNQEARDAFAGAIPTIEIREEALAEEETIVTQEVRILSIADLQSYIGENYLFFFVSTSLHLILATVAVFCFEKMCKALGSCTSPFEEDVTQRMIKFAKVFVVTVVYAIVSSFVESAIVNAGTSWKFDISFWDVVLIAIVMMLVYVFKYGAVLQRESDETL